MMWAQIIDSTQIKIPMAPETKPGTYWLNDFVKEDRKQMSNLDRFMQATIPQVKTQYHSLSDLLKVYQ